MCELREIIFDVEALHFKEKIYTDMNMNKLKKYFQNTLKFADHLKRKIHKRLFSFDVIYFIYKNLFVNQQRLYKSILHLIILSFNLFSKANSYYFTSIFYGYCTKHFD